MRRLLATALLLAAASAAVVLTAARDGGGALQTLEIEVDNAFGLAKGGDLKIGGVKAGQTTDFRITRTEPYRTVVKAEINVPGFDSLREDARCDVRQQSLIGEYFLDCDLGRSSRKLPDGGRIPVKRTTSTIPPDLINDVMRRPYRERFRLIISELGTGLAGRPQELNRVIRRAHPALRELTETLAILRRQNTVIRDFIRDADTVSANVEPFREDVARWARESSDTAAIQASRSEQLGRYWSRLPDFLGELRPTLAELERTANSQIPTLRSLQRAAPDLERFLRAAQPFARSSRGSLKALGDASKTGSAAISESRNEIRELRRLARFAPRLGKPLRQFLQAIDDRRRSTDNDPAAGRTAPPAPDKTAFKRGQGFTGMEALWNYIYFQTLGINAFDELGHLLRIVQIQGDPCAPYVAQPNKEEIARCNSWLGPSQPGVDGQPDPTEGGGAARTRRVRSNDGGGPAGVPPGSGGPSAPPTPGKRDLSKPQQTLPPEVRRLLEGVPEAPKLPRLPDPGDRSSPDPTDLLDYLLAP